MNIKRGRSFGRAAQKYYPDLCYSKAVERFRRELNDTPGLLDELTQIGYFVRSRYLNARQMAVIINRLGEF